MMKRHTLLAILVFVFTKVVAQEVDMGHTIVNDTFWHTTDGQPIYSQGGGVFRFPDPTTGRERYYWYGVHYHGAEVYYQGPTQKYEGTGFKSISCYVSDNLTDWMFAGDVATTETVSHGYWVGRLGVAWLKDAKLYALLVQYNNSVLILTGENPAGPFKWHRTMDMKDRIGTPNTGDQTVFTDVDTGKSYLICSNASGRNRTYISEIVWRDGQVTLLDSHLVFEGAGREGNCMFKYRGKYYLCASNLYGWNASHVYYLEADNIMGPYTPANQMNIMPGAEMDYGHVTQTGFFYTIRGTKQETVIYCGDRWADFAGNGNGYNQWCPISFTADGRPYFNSLSHWHLNAETGEWWVGNDNNYVRNGSFEADRMSVPSSKKPVQDFILGWTTDILKGNHVEVGKETSPVLNAKNSVEDRAIVKGNHSLLISDCVAFKRRVSQKVTSTPFVPLRKGTYRLKAMVLSSGQFEQLYLYANGEKNYRMNITRHDGVWHEVTIDGIECRSGQMEIGIYAEGQPNALCRMDDVELCLLTTATSQHATTVFMIGDSTMANKDTTGGKQERGWGMMLQECFEPQHILIDNHAVNGRSSLSFINEGRWGKVLEKMHPGDYVIIQFGHNDEKPQADRHTEPGSTFDANLERFVNESRQRGGIPILMNAVVRRNFAEEGDSLIDTHGRYREVPAQVAEQLHVPFVDANQITHDLEQRMGKEGSKRLHLWFQPGEHPSEPKGKQDNTHYSIEGARTVARLLADALCEAVPMLRPYRTKSSMVAPANVSTATFDNPDTIVVDAQGTGQFRTIAEAIEVCRAFMDYHKVIYVKNGIYKEKLIIPQWLQNIEICGEDRERTIITFDDHANVSHPETGLPMGTFRTYTLKIEGNDITLKNLTVQNNAARLGQAVALHTEGDHLVFINCRFIGHQDTIYTGMPHTRLYFEHCYICGTTDFIFGASTAWFEDCTIESLSNSYITAASTPADQPFGYIFNHCLLIAADGVDKVYLGRPWRDYGYTLFMHCDMGKHIRPEGWHHWQKNREQTARYMEYDNRGEGANTLHRVSWSRRLSPKEAKKITIEKVFGIENGWKPHHLK